MRALRLFGKKDIRLCDVPVPETGNDEILLKVDACAVCGTDVRMWQNGSSGVDENHPMTLGHELAGTIAKVGANVECYKEGDVVALAPNMGCGVCSMCTGGRPHLCGEHRAFGINMDGGFAEYTRIPARAIRQGNLTIMPKGVSPAEAAINEPLSCAYNGFLKNNVQPGEYALVVGAGPIGLFHAMLLKMAGAAKVIMNDISEYRLKTAEEAVPGVLTYIGDDLKGFVMEVTDGRGLDIAITANPVPEVQAAMLPLMDYGGRVNFFGGVPHDKQPVPIDTNLVHYKELILTGATRASAAMFAKTLGFIAAGLLPVKNMVTHTYSLEETPQAFENAKNAVGLKHVIVF